MATAERYTLINGSTLWRVRYRIDGRSTSKRGFTTRRDALAHGAEIEVRKARGTYTAPTDGRATIGDLGPAWLSQQGHQKPSSLRVLEVALRLQVLPTWQSVRIGTIKPSAVRSWVAKLSAHYSPTIVIRAHGILTGILDDAVGDRLIPSNPARGVKLPPKRRKPQVYLSHDQVWALADAAGDHAALILTLAYTGLRWGEAAALRVGDLDLLRRRVTVNENVVRVGGQIIIGTPKSNRARTVPFPAALVELLARQCEDKARRDLLFPAGHGGYLQQANSTRGWFPAAVTRSAVPRVTPHDLRHTAASLAVSAGANVKAVQAMLGHASAAMTLDVYADLFSDDLDRVAERLDQAIRERPQGQNVSTGVSTNRARAL